MKQVTGKKHTANTHKQDHEHIVHDPVFADAIIERLNKSGMIVLDAQGNCVRVSKRMLQTLGMAAKQLQGKNFFAALPLRTLEGALVDERKNPVWQALQKKTFTQITPFFCKRVGDAADQMYAMNVLQVKKQNQVFAVVVQIRKAEREINIGEMKSLFVSFAAHQLKTPSSVVKGFVELLMREGEGSYTKDQWQFIISAYESNEHLIRVSKSLLSMARLDGGLIEPALQTFDPNTVLRSRIQAHQSLLDIKNLRVVFTGKESGYLTSDESFFSEIFEILLGNAIKHSPSGTIITVTCTVNSNEVVVHVIDQGPGIPLSTQEHLFKSVQDSTPDNNSHGLGLYMAKKYLALLGGTIHVVSSSAGSDFSFSVPQNIG